MAIQLYREGSTHTVRGVDCEIGNFQPIEMEAMLKEGWVKDPSEIGVEAPKKPVKEEKGKDDTSIDPVRLAAKKAGIENWESKRIKTLEAELSD